MKKNARKGRYYEKENQKVCIADGLKYLKSQQFIYLFVVFNALFTIFMSPLSVLTQLQVMRNFSLDLWRLSAIKIAFSSGCIVGGVLIGIWRFRKKIVAIGTASVAIGILTILFGLWTHFIPYLVCMIICGMTVPYFSAPSMTLIQEKAAPEYLGRVLSVFTMIGSLAMPFSMLFFGPLGDAININYILIGSGVVMLFLGTFYFTLKPFRTVDTKPSNDTLHTGR